MYFCLGAFVFNSRVQHFHCVVMILPLWLKRSLVVFAFLSIGFLRSGVTASVLAMAAPPQPNTTLVGSPLTVSNATILQEPLWNMGLPGQLYTLIRFRGTGHGHVSHSEILYLVFFSFIEGFLCLIFWMCGVVIEAFAFLPSRIPIVFPKKTCLQKIYFIGRLLMCLKAFRKSRLRADILYMILPCLALPKKVNKSKRGAASPASPVWDGGGQYPCGSGMYVNICIYIYICMYVPNTIEIISVYILSTLQIYSICILFPVRI